MGDGEQTGERGASLVGVLSVLVMLGFMAVVVVKALPAVSPNGTSPTLQELTGGADLAAGGSAGGAAGRTPLPVAGAGAACTATVGTLETAAAAKHAGDGAFPATVDELVRGRWLSEAPALPGYEITMAVVGGQPNGKVLVNGLTPDQGCAGPPRVGPRPGPKP